jgi:hypothetical protein
MKRRKNPDFQTLEIVDDVQEHDRDVRRNPYMGEPPWTEEVGADFTEMGAYHPLAGLGIDLGATLKKAVKSGVSTAKTAVKKEVGKVATQAKTSAGNVMAQSGAAMADTPEAKALVEEQLRKQAEAQGIKQTAAVWSDIKSGKYQKHFMIAGVVLGAFLIYRLFFKGRFGRSGGLQPALATNPRASRTGLSPKRLAKRELIHKIRKAKSKKQKRKYIMKLHRINYPKSKRYAK